MKNFKLIIEYDGTNYNGWQRQAADPTVQAEIEQALSAMTRSDITLIGAGRTDAGVHALGQAAHFHCETRLDPGAILKGLNSLLPPDIAICDCRRVPRTSTPASLRRARSTATGSGISCTAAVGRNCVDHHRTPMSGAMQQAAQFIVGRHDFKAFESTEARRTVRHVLAAERAEEGVGPLTFQSRPTVSALHGAQHARWWQRAWEDQPAESRRSWRPGIGPGRRHRPAQPVLVAAGPLPLRLKLGPADQWYETA
jgi:tRNA pseudouridine38-40 synthase